MLCACCQPSSIYSPSNSEPRYQFWVVKIPRPFQSHDNSCIRVGQNHHKMLTGGGQFGCHDPTHQYKSGLARDVEPHSRTADPDHCAYSGWNNHCHSAYRTRRCSNSYNSRLPISHCRLMELYIDSRWLGYGPASLFTKSGE